MAFPLSRETIEAAFVAACHAELHALKPGNVHVHAPGHDMDVSHFERAAAAAAPFIADETLGVGARVLAAVSASMAAAGCNTNLGILLLGAPLAVAAAAPEGPQDLRARLARVLAALDLKDADETFRAIVLANPGGLGGAEEGDVTQPPSMTLIEAMRLAQDRDRIAHAYVTGFEDIFTFALPELYAARRSAQDEPAAITALHMALLSAFPDSHILRKYGPDAALAVQREARALKSLWHPAPRQESRPALLDLDRSFKERALNPGTTADFVVGTLFADLLIHPRATNGRS